MNAARFLSEFLQKDDAPAFASAVENTRRTGERFYFLGRFRRKDGELRWIEFTGQPGPAVEGNLEDRSRIEAIYTGENQIAFIDALDVFLVNLSRRPSSDVVEGREDFEALAFQGCEGFFDKPILRHREEGACQVNAFWGTRLRVNGRIIERRGKILSEFQALCVAEISSRFGGHFGGLGGREAVICPRFGEYGGEDIPRSCRAGDP